MLLAENSSLRQLDKLLRVGANLLDGMRLALSAVTAVEQPLPDADYDQFGSSSMS